MALAEIGIIGGSGFYHLFKGARELTVQTPYGPASDAITIGELGGRVCAFLPRHGQRHHLPPHRVPYRANIYALKELGVSWIVGTNAVGALADGYAVGDFVAADQLIDFTHGTRVDTFFDGPITTHVSFTEPYCPAMRAAAMEAATGESIQLHSSATIVVVNGPRFPSLAESRWYAAQGWQLENMTQYPEAILARELTLSYMNLSLVTNSHQQAQQAGSGDLAVAAGVMEVLRDKRGDLERLLAATAGKLPPAEERPDFIKQALERGRWV